jgi:HlyD family secretion protein
MSKRTMALVVVGMVAAASAIIAAVGFPGGQSPAPATAASSTADKRWLAVAPGRIEPRSGQIKLAVPVVGVVGSVLVKSNDTVFAGEPLIQLKDDELSARLAAALSQVAVRKRARNEQSASSRVEERRKAEDAVADAEQAVADAQDAVDSAAAKWRASGQPDATLTNARADLSRAQDELSRRKTALRKLDAPLPTALEGALIAARADLTVARAALDKLTLRAPIDGTVLQVNIKPGELASPAAPQPMVLLANLSALRVRAELDERDVTGIKNGQSATIRANAFANREFTGKVAAIAPLIEPARISARGGDSRTDVDTVEVLVDLAQPGPLSVGMRVDVYFDREGPPTQ